LKILAVHNELTRSDTNELLKSTREMTLVGEARLHSRLDNRRTLQQQPLRAKDATLCLVLKWRHANLFSEGPEEVISADLR